MGSELATDALAMVAPPPFTIRDDDSGSSLLKPKCILIICMLLRGIFSPLSLHAFSKIALGSIYPHWKVLQVLPFIFTFHGPTDFKGFVKRVFTTFTKIPALMTLHP